MTPQSGSTHTRTHIVEKYTISLREMWLCWNNTENKRRLEHGAHGWFLLTRVIHSFWRSRSRLSVNLTTLETGNIFYPHVPFCLLKCLKNGSKQKENGDLGGKEIKQVFHKNCWTKTEVRPKCKCASMWGKYPDMPEFWLNSSCLKYQLAVADILNWL